MATGAPLDQKKLDLVFTFDCTGSMGEYILAAKQGIENIAQRLVQSEGYDLRFGLVAYRDHPPQDKTFVTKSFPFTASLADIHCSLSSLSADGGGDGPEAVAAALKATCDADWRDDATKVCILIADAPPHGLGESGDGFPDGDPDGVDPLAVLDKMSSMGVTVYSVGCQPALSSYRFATEFFIACAERTNGQAVALGSAAALADVIMGGAIEEMDLEALSNQVAGLSAQYRALEPGMDDEEVQRRVWGDLQSNGIQTRQLDTPVLSSDYAGFVSKAPSLAVAKASLEEHVPPAARGAHFGFGGGAREMEMLGSAPPGAPGAFGFSCAPPTPCSTRGRPMPDDSFEAGPSVKLSSAPVSMEQVGRLYGRCKAKGML